MTAIEFENISKQYRLGLVSTGTLSHDLNRFWQTKILRREDPYLKVGELNDRASKGNSEYVWALKDINFKVEQGDVVGIIGRNGAGKSTLLKLLSRVTAPTTGTIRARGRIASLLEVGTGFHPEMTGRENIYMNGSIMGMSRAEITRKLDEIVDFSGCERYLDTPVKRYSSGMTVRLGFAIAAHLEPEILVVDEVLAVGDAEFQKKAIGKMQDVSKGEGRTVLFVSHNMGAVKNLCTRGILLENGQMAFSGRINDVINSYQVQHKSNLTNIEVLADATKRKVFRSLDVEFVSFSFIKNIPTFASDEDIKLKITLKGNKEKENCRINCTLRDLNDNPLGSLLSRNFFSIKQGDIKVFEYTIKAPHLTLGFYFISLYVGIGDVTSGLKDFDGQHNILSFEINQASLKNNLFFGKWDHSWGNICLEDEPLKEIK